MNIMYVHIWRASGLGTDCTCLNCGHACMNIMYVHIWRVYGLGTDCTCLNCVQERVAPVNMAMAMAKPMAITR